MPFELGLACAFKLQHPTDYDGSVLDAIPFCPDGTSSDDKGRDLIVHAGMQWHAGKLTEYIYTLLEQCRVRI